VVVGEEEESRRCCQITTHDVYDNPRAAINKTYKKTEISLTPPPPSLVESTEKRDIVVVVSTHAGGCD